MRNHSVRDALMPRTAQHQTDSELRSASVNRPSPVAFVSGSQLQKDAERAELAELLDRFREAGGSVQVLGITPVRTTRTRLSANREACPARVTGSRRRSQ